ncbi:uncharacterized protein LOC135548430 isoform X3 [Oncorhynchus masou masou]|uniref:uncharacterized protein LOC135548430 isoform X3 n=1 Tax=Oncorhynchus masou masou TaxID=90313 RepID=UPI003182EB78
MMTGQKMYAANQYTTSYVASTFKSKPKEKQQAPPTPIPETEIPEAKPLPEAGSSEPVMPAVDEATPSEPGSAPVPIEEGVPSEAEPAPQPTTEVAPAEGYIDTEPAAAEGVVLQEC